MRLVHLSSGQGATVPYNWVLQLRKVLGEAERDDLWDNLSSAYWAVRKSEVLASFAFRLQCEEI